MSNEPNSDGQYRCNTRAAAASAVDQIVHSRTRLNQVLDAAASEFSSKDRQFIADVVYGVVRWYFLLSAYANHLLSHPLKGKHRDIFCLLLVGLYQIEYMRVPSYAAVSETVSGASVLGKSWARNLVNAVLRKFLLNRDSVLSIERDDSANYSHPQWIIDLLRKQWPDEWATILHANNMKPQMVVRVNPQKCSVSEYQDMLDRINIQADPDGISPYGIRLKDRIAVSKLPGFAEGFVSVQNSASQLAAPALDIQAGHRVLDACAAPGGKLTHMLELHPDTADTVALDISKTRCDEILDNLARVGKSAIVMTADAAQPKNWWNGKHFDRILLDAPCSALGVVQKHPDIKIHRCSADIVKSSNEQKRLLGALLPLLGAGGKLLYCTCSIVAAENDEVVDSVLHVSPGVTVEKLGTVFGRETKYGRQRLQGIDNSDGFYYSLLTVP